METILSKLEEAVITKDVENNISFTNEKGQKIVRMITKFMQNKLNGTKISDKVVLES